MAEPFLHNCHCGKWGAFGYGVQLLKDKKGQWFCAEHRPAKEQGNYLIFQRDGYQLMERKHG